MQEQSPLKKGYAYPVLLFLHPYIEIVELFAYKCCGKIWDKIALAAKISLSPLFWMHAKISEVTSSATKIFVILFHFTLKFSPQKTRVKQNFTIAFDDNESTATSQHLYNTHPYISMVDYCHFTAP